MEKTTLRGLKKTNTPVHTGEKVQNQPMNPSQLSKNEEFQILQTSYQTADFTKCGEIIELLEESYPNHPILQKFREEIEIRQTFRKVTTSHKKTKKHKKLTIRLRLAAFAFLSTLIVMLAFIFSYFYFSMQVSAQEINDEASQLAELSAQVEHLILVGKPRPAVERLTRMREINSEDDRLLELESQVYALLLLETKYQTATDLQEHSNDLEALELFREIEAEWPGLWDVPHQINVLEDRNYP
jgi:hypothetical protein